MTIAQAAVIVGRSQGLPLSFDGSTQAINALSADRKITLTGGIGAYIRQNPANFTPAQVSTAGQMFTPGSPPPLANTTFNLGDLVVEIGSNANDLVVRPFVTLGQNVSNTANLIAVAFPLIVLAAAYFFLKPYLFSNK